MNLYEKGLRRTLALSLCTCVLVSQITLTGFAVCYDAISGPAAEIESSESADVDGDIQPVETTTPPEIDIPKLPEPPEFSGPILLPRPSKPTEQEPETTPTEPETEPTKPDIQYYDVPLDEDLQLYIFELCEEHDIDSALVIAVIRAESTYKTSTVGDSGRSLGLMQIQPRWHKERMDRLNCPDLLDPYQNVTVGIDILSDYFEKGKPVEWVLMAYNGGGNYANRKWKAGEISDYAQTVLKYKDQLSFKEE